MKKPKKIPTLDELRIDADRAKEAWHDHYRKYEINTGCRPPLKVRLTNNGLWIRWKNRLKKYDAAYAAARSLPPA